MSELKKKKAIEAFRMNQTESNFLELLACGLYVKKLINNQWKHNLPKLPIEKFMTLYDDYFKISGIGIY